MGTETQLPTRLWDYELNREIHNALPDIVIDFLAIVTHLGDGAVLVGMTMLFYWFGGEIDWRKRGKLLAVALAALALSAGLKGILEITRPLYVAQPPLEFAPESYEGLSTPSAHAMGSAAIYGSLAVIMDAGKRWHRYLVTAVIVALVSLSRVTLGVHYVGDVILGAGIGLFLVWFGVWIVDETPRSVLPLFFFSFLVSVFAYVAGSREFVTLTIGASFGGLVVWWLIHETDPEPLGASELLLGLVLLPIFLVFSLLNRIVVVEFSMEFAGMEVPFVEGLELAGFSVLFGLALALPLLAERIDSSSYVQRLQYLLPFRGRVFDVRARQDEFPEERTD